VTQIEVKLNPDVTPAGSDLSVVNAARRSFNTRSEWNWSKELESGTGDGRTLKDKDKRLLEFLARGMTAADFEKFMSKVGDCTEEDSWEPQELKELLWQWRNTPTHDTPFNHTFISFEVQAPIFVRAQLVKHEYLIMSEFSRRYITDDIKFYEPGVWRKAAENKKQGSSDEEVKDLVVEGHDRYLPKHLKETMGVKDAYDSVLNESVVSLYKDMIHAGVAPEQARMVLPQSTMTEWTWSGTLGAFAKMCTLRLHPEAQYEARVVANKVYEYLKEYYPVGAVALVEGV
jgi:thymidylate synthase (FAD)